MKKLFLALVAFGFFLCAQSAVAQTTARLCPHSCQSEGIPKSQCKDWRQGNICYVQRLGSHNHQSNTLGAQHHNHQANNHQNITQNGNLSYGRCPHSCASVGLPKSRCQDWRQGNTCYVRRVSHNPNYSNHNVPNAHSIPNAHNRPHAPVYASNSNAGVRSGPCPFSCASSGLPKSRCKDWRNGNVCYVQSF